MAVNAAQFVCLFFQQAGEDDAAAGFGAGGEHFAEHAQRVGQNVGNDDIELPVRQFVGQVELRFHAVLHGIVGTGRNRLRVDVYADGRACAEFEGGNRQDAGTAAVVQHAFAAVQVVIQPLQTQAGGGVAARAES